MRLPQRLSKFVRDSSDLSAAALMGACGAGRLCWKQEGEAVQAVTERHLNLWVYEEEQVWLDGMALQLRTIHHATLLNKPKATLCVPRDLRGKGDLGPWLERMPKGVFAVGRLDRDTTGALLFTTDGDLANGLLRPERHADKLYELTIAERLEPADVRLEALRRGVDVGPYFAKAKGVELVSVADRSTQLELILDEGRHRQIRRMCRTVGLPLRALHRRSVGPVDVSGLALGQWRALSDAEVESLWNVTGGRERLLREKFQALVDRAARLREQGRNDAKLERWLVAHPQG